MSLHHVIIGGGPAATNAIETIREIDGGASRITLISDEPAHSRMAVPYWLSGQIVREHTYTADDDYLRNRLKVEPRIGVRVQRVDPAEKQLALSDGSMLAFDRLLIATGSSPAALRIPGADLPGVQPLWSLAHTQQVLDYAGSLPRPRVVLIGAGFVGFIVLNAMYKRGWQLAVVEREAHVLPRMLDPDSAELVRSWLSSRGVQSYCRVTVEEIRPGTGTEKTVVLSDGTMLPADLVIVGVGVRPNLDLVQDSGIEVEQGILVDNHLRTNFPDIFAGGDVAQGPVLYSNQREIHAIQPTAVDHGRVAGANMAGQEVQYPGSLAMNVVDVCGLQCASFGNWSNQTAEPTVISNPQDSIYRKFLWEGDQITGAIFTGRANDVGMLTDVGMIKGILQTQTGLGPWKEYLQENPFDIRRAYVASGVAQRLAQTTLLNRPNRGRKYHFGGSTPGPQVTPAHAAYVSGGPGH